MTKEGQFFYSQYKTEKHSFMKLYYYRKSLKKYQEEKNSNLNWLRKVPKKKYGTAFKLPSRNNDLE